MKIRTQLIGTIVVGAALLVPLAQAQRPDDRAGLRGPGAFASTEASSATHPDNLGGTRGPGAIDAQGGVVDTQRAVVRPDDRAGARGPGALGSRDTSIVTHPDNRAVRYGPGGVSNLVVADRPAGHGFDWSDGLIGWLGGAGIALLLTGGAFLLMSQRNRARTA
jgi:hypothetical protein